MAKTSKKSNVVVTTELVEDRFRCFTLLLQQQYMPDHKDVESLADKAIHLVEKFHGR